MLKTTVGQLLVNEALPEDMRNYSRILDKKTTPQLFHELATKYPEQYAEVAKKLSDIGHRTAYETGGFSPGIDALRAPEKARQERIKIQNDIEKILTNRTLKSEEKERRVIELLKSRTGDFEKLLFDEAVKEKNPLAYQVASGARGNPGNLRSVIGADFLYVDHRDKPVPIPVLRSYAQGVTPAEFFAGTFGTRKGIVDLKFATQDAGFFGKQLNQASHRLVVTDHDTEYGDTVRGVPMPVDDPDNEGALLAIPTGKFKRNTVLTPKVLAELKSKGHDRILVRSPIVGGSPKGGLYAADVGVRERGTLPQIGEFIGMSAAQATSEPLTQAQISSKHTGGVAGAGGAISGFKVINQLVQVPKTFTGGAAHAQKDGKVGAIYDAPAGGKYVLVGGQRHYVGTGLGLKVKPGQTVEAGDVISEGLPNPAEIVAHKGIGEGRRYFVDIIRDLYKNSGIKAHRRNLELLSRGLVNHVQLSEEMGDFLPEDIVPYDVIERQYRPRKGNKVIPVRSATNKYLEKPVLHYSIGTQLKPSMLKELSTFGVKDVTVHDDPPPFSSMMVRAMENISHDPDWMTRQLGTGLKKNVLSAVHRGATSDEAGTSFVPGLARAKDFGRVGLIKGWDPEELKRSKLNVTA